MSKRQVINLNELDVNKVKVVKNDKYYNLTYEDKPFLLRIKDTRTPFGISDWNGNKKYTMLVDIKEEDKEKLNEMKNVIINQLLSDTKLLDDVKVKTKNKEALQNIFNDMYRVNNNKEYFDTIKLNIVKDYNIENNYKLFLVKNKEPLGKSHKIETLQNEVERNSKLVAVFNPVFYIIGGKSMGVSMRAHALKFERAQNRVSYQEFLFDDE